MINFRSKTEDLVKVKDEELYIFPRELFGTKSDALGIINGGLRGNGKPIVIAHTKPDRREPTVYVNLYQIPYFEVVNKPVPSDIVSLFESEDEEDIIKVNNYFNIW